MSKSITPSVLLHGGAISESQSLEGKHRHQPQGLHRNGIVPMTGWQRRALEERHIIRPADEQVGGSGARRGGDCGSENIFVEACRQLPEADPRISTTQLTGAALNYGASNRAEAKRGGGKTLERKRRRGFWRLSLFDDGRGEGIAPRGSA